MFIQTNSRKKVQLSLAKLSVLAGEEEGEGEALLEQIEHELMLVQAQVIYLSIYLSIGMRFSTKIRTCI